MTNESQATQSKSRRMLDCCRRAIDRFPPRQQAALLHEFEEAETRLTAIERTRAEAGIALAEYTTREMTGRDRSEAAGIDFQQTLRALRTIQNRLTKQVEQGQRRLNRR